MTVKVLFVCLGNICRSPTAHGVFQQKVDKAGLTDQIKVESAGTGSWHIGDPPDRRATEVARKRGYDISQLRAQKVCREDFDTCDYILAMDKANLADLKLMRPDNFNGTLCLFLEYLSDPDYIEVPDPYYGGKRGFDTVLDLLESASDSLLESIKAHLTGR